MSVFLKTKYVIDYICKIVNDDFYKESGRILNFHILTSYGAFKGIIHTDSLNILQKQGLLKLNGLKGKYNNHDEKLDIVEILIDISDVISIGYDDDKV